MDRANYFNGQRVTSDDLNYTESSKALHMQQQLAFEAGKSTHSVSASVPANFQQTVVDTSPSFDLLNGVGGGYGSTHLQPATGSLTQISIARGWALTEGMDLINISATVTVNQNDNSATARWVDTGNGMLYVAAEYQETSGSVQANVNGTAVYTRYTPSYRINISSQYPSGSNQVPLARFTGNSGAITADTFVDIRTWFRPNAMAENTIIKSPVVTGITTMEQHQAAVGHAAATSINPHGTSLVDISGIPPFLNGIYVMDRQSTTFQSYSGSLGPAAWQISFANPSHATASVGNTVFTNSLPFIDATGAADGVYYVVATPVAGSLTSQYISTGSITFDSLIPQANPSYLLLGRATISSQTFTVYQDQRQFYIDSPAVIRADEGEAYSSPALALAPYSTLTDSLNRIRYQLGLALSGSGSAWSGANPLTAGSGSVADAYHSHSTVSAIITDQYTGFRNTGSVRAYGQAYQNTTGKTMWVAAWSAAIVYNGGNVYNTFWMSPTDNPPDINEGNVYAQQVLDNTNISTIAMNMTLHQYVPAGWYYLVTGSIGANPLSSLTLIGWQEWV